MSRRKGFTIAEVLIASVVSVMAATACWALYVMGNDFYQNSMDLLRVQNVARTATEAMLFGLNGEGLMQATGYTTTQGATAVTYNGRILNYDVANRRITCTDNQGNNPMGITPAYVQANGGVAVTYFSINNLNDVPVEDQDLDADDDGTQERIYITFRVESLLPNTDPDPSNHGPNDIKAETQLTISSRGRRING